MSGEDMGVAASPPGHQPTASEPHGSSCKHGVPDAYLTKMLDYVRESWNEKSWTERELWLCPELYRGLSQNGERPSELFGVKLREVDTWSWGWMLMVGWAAGRLYPFEPAQAIEARQRHDATTGVAREGESAVGEADAPEYRQCEGCGQYLEDSEPEGARYCSACCEAFRAPKDTHHDH